MRKVAVLLMLLFSFGCGTHQNNYYLLVRDTVTDQSGYVNLKGDTVIPLGKYSMCYTDTFKNYAIVSKPQEGLVAIDKKEKVLYSVYVFDNGPDYPSEGLFRIIKNGKIGYADLNGKVVIPPKYMCAFPFEKGIARVSDNCQTIPDPPEHYAWASKHWIYINKSGNQVSKAE